MITSMSSRAVDMIAQEMEAAVQAVAEKHGIGAKRGKYTYSNGATGTVRIEIAIKAADGSVVNKEAEAFKELATLYGLQPTDLNRKFRNGNRIFQITGLRTSARSKPILAKDIVNEKEYIFPVQSVLNALSREVAAV